MKKLLAAVGFVSCLAVWSVRADDFANTADDTVAAPTVDLNVVPSSESSTSVFEPVLFDTPELLAATGAVVPVDVPTECPITVPDDTSVDTPASGDTPAQLALDGALAPQVLLVSKNDQYAYVARNLGLLDSSKGWWRWWCGFLKKYNLELSVGGPLLLETTALLLIARFAEKKTYKNEGLWAAVCKVLDEDGALYALGGTMVGLGLLFGFVNNFCGKVFANDTDWYRGKLVSFVEQWNMHKQYTPSELRPLFDRLVAINASFKFDDAFVQEVYKQVADLSVKGMAAKPA